MPDKLLECLEKVTEENTDLVSAEPSSSTNCSESNNALSKAVSDEECFRIFDQKLQYLGKVGSLTDLDKLTDWLVNRALQVGAAQAVEEARAYSKSSEVNVYEVLLLAKTYSDVPSFQFSNGVVFAMPNALPMEDFADGVIGQGFFSPIPWPSVVGVLFKGFNQAVKHTPSEYDAVEKRDSRPADPIEIPIDDLMDVARCMALSRLPRFGIHAIAHGTVAPDTLPFLSKWGSWDLHALRRPAVQPSIRETEFTAADQILTRYVSLEESWKKKVNISIDHINKFASSETPVERAISLRVCLDSLFGEGVSSELAFRISLRAANFLGSSNSEKTEIFRSVRQAYHETSAAVHNGALNKNFDSNKMIKAASLARKAILKVIEHGNVIWSDIELGLADK